MYQKEYAVRQQSRYISPRRRRKRTRSRVPAVLAAGLAVLLAAAALHAAMPKKLVLPAPGAQPESGNARTDDWRLTLVNPWNPLPAEHSIELTQLSGGQAVDKRCYPDLQAMMDACREEGLSPLICSSYRSREKQQELYDNKISRLTAQGYDQEKAVTEAGKEVALPGTSEHQLGLALDIVDVENQNLDKTQEDTAVQKWLMAHSWEYGFILRYPNEKSELTGIIYEPWHYRYVGREAAQEIHEQGICLEEYLQNG